MVPLRDDHQTSGAGVNLLRVKKGAQVRLRMTSVVSSEGRRSG